MWTKYGIKALANFEKVATTFSASIEEDLLTEIGMFRKELEFIWKISKSTHDD
jgi:hypothetical protein